MPSKTETRYVVNGAVTADISLRKSPDPASPDYEQWHVWKAGEVFVPPAHMNVERALARGIIVPAVEVSDG